MGATKTADFYNGMVIRYNNDLYTVTEFHHVSPGNWRAFVRVNLKNLRTGRVIEQRFRAGEEISAVRVEHQNWQFLYIDGDDYVFMNTETFDQQPIAKEITAFIRDRKFKVTTQIQGSEIRVASKSKDELQTTIAALRAGEFPAALQFVNFRE